MANKTVISQGLPVHTTSPGTADIVGFGQDGVYVLRNSLNPQAVNVLKKFGVDQGWDTAKHIRLVAVTNNAVPPCSDIVGFGDDGVYISLNLGNNAFSDPILVLKDFGYINGGWRVEKHIRYMADLRKTGTADIIGFGEDGVWVSNNSGGGKFSPAQNVLADFAYGAGGWRLDRHLRFLADTTGDGCLDIVGFGESQVYVSQNDTKGGFAPPKAVLENFTPAQGWVVGKHPRFLADLTGDGKVDIIGFGETGVYVSLNKGARGFGPVTKVLDGHFAPVPWGWRVEDHPLFVADLTGDGRGDIIGFKGDLAWVSLNNGNGTFQTPRSVLREFVYDKGWRVKQHPRFVADLTGNGCADIIGFGDKTTFVSFNDGKGGFGPSVTLTSEFTFNDGQWSRDKTVRLLANLYLQ